MTKLTETQTIILITGVQRPENIAMPLPKGLAGAAAKMAVRKMIERGWLREVDANLRQGEPLWRETGDGHGTTLVVTNAGLLAIGIEPVVVKTMTAIHKHAAEPPSPKPPTPRPGTKQGYADLTASGARRHHNGSHDYSHLLESSHLAWRNVGGVGQEAGVDCDLGEEGRRCTGLSHQPRASLIPRWSFSQTAGSEPRSAGTRHR